MSSITMYLKCVLLCINVWTLVCAHVYVEVECKDYMFWCNYVSVLKAFCVQRNKCIVQLVKEMQILAHNRLYHTMEHLEMLMQSRSHMRKMSTKRDNHCFML